MSRIQNLVESGIIKFKLREQLPDTEICPLNLGNKERRLRNSDLVMTYLIVGAGLVLSGLIFITEVIILKIKNNVFCTRDVINRTTKKNANIYENYEQQQDIHIAKKFLTPPPSYNTLFNPKFTYNNGDYKKKVVNGREYWINHSKFGTTELIPHRTPSALLFQYSN